MDKYEKDIEVLKKIVLTGNGHKPLTESITIINGKLDRMDEKMDGFSTDIHNLSTNIGALMKNKIEDEARQDERDKIQKKRTNTLRWVVALVTGAIISIIGILIKIKI